MFIEFYKNVIFLLILSFAAADQLAFLRRADFS